MYFLIIEFEVIFKYNFIEVLRMKLRHIFQRPKISLDQPYNKIIVICIHHIKFLLIGIGSFSDFFCEDPDNQSIMSVHCISCR